MSMVPLRRLYWQYALWLAVLLALSSLVTAQSQLPLAEFPHTVTVSGAAWSPDGERILSWGNAPDDCQQDCHYTLYLWDVSVSAPPHTIEHEQPIGGASWSPDGAYVLAWSGDAAYLWPSRDGGASLTLRQDEPSAVRGAQWSPDGSRVLTWSDDTTAHVWSLDSSAEPMVLRQNPEGWEYPLFEAMWTANGCCVLGRVSGEGIGQTAFAWTLDGGERIALAHDSFINGMIPGSDGSRVLTWSADHTARLWALDGSAPPILFKHDLAVNHAAWNGSDNVLITGDEIGNIYEWTWGDCCPESTLLNHPGGAYGVSASPTFAGAFATWPAGTSGRHEVRVWGFGRYPVEPIGLLHDSAILGVAWNDQPALLTWAEDGTVRIYDQLTDMIGLPAAMLPHEGTVGGAAWSPDGERTLIWVGSTVYVWGSPTPS